jgi:hypothetical protein
MKGLSGIYWTEKRRGIAMAAYLMKYRRTQYRPKLKYTALLQNLTKLDNLVEIFFSHLSL